jgi:tetratricopeptide (TPR) repeat protein
MKILWFLFVSLLQASDAQWSDAMRRARELQGAGNYRAAEQAMASAVALAEQSDVRDTRLARSLTGLASVNQDLANYDAAEQLYRRAIAAIERNLGNGDPALYEPLNGLASLYHQTRRYAQAELLTLRCLSVSQDRQGTAQQLGNLAAVYQAQHKYAEAEDFYRRALTLFDLIGGPASSEMAMN